MRFIPDENSFHRSLPENNGNGRSSPGEDQLTAPSIIGEQPPLPDSLSGVIEQAVEERASDVHIDTWHGEASLRFRVDGLIYIKERLSETQARRLMNQIKVAARLSPEATHKPLEGQFRWSSSEAVRDVRVTVIPTAPRYESMHLRLLTAPESWRNLAQLGLEDHELQLIKRVVDHPHGLVLIAGPTGSGKSTTLYSIGGMAELRDKVTVSIEEPAEFDLPFVRQLEVNHHRGLTMGVGLRTLLRMDPDVLLVGEVRDQESAMIAAQASLAGRLVIATVHGRDAAGAIQAMQYLGVPAHILGGALRLVIAQNLVRCVCRACARTRPLEESEAALFADARVAAPERVLESRGCKKCQGYGYLGRAGVFQVAAIDDELGGWLSQGPTQQLVRRRLRADGVQPLVTNSLRKVVAQVTTMAEIMRFFGDSSDRAIFSAEDIAEVARG